jgi:acetyl-CoA acetyltransferase
MGIGPVPAIQALFKATGKSVKDIDLVEVSVM